MKKLIFSLTVLIATAFSPSKSHAQGNCFPPGCLSLSLEQWQGITFMVYNATTFMDQYDMKVKTNPGPFINVEDGGCNPTYRFRFQPALNPSVAIVPGGTDQYTGSWLSIYNITNIVQVGPNLKVTADVQLNTCQ